MRKFSKIMFNHNNKNKIESNGFVTFQFENLITFYLKKMAQFINITVLEVQCN